MNEKALKTLEFDKILARLADYADTAAGKERCHALRPLADLEEIRAALAETEAARIRLAIHGNLSFGGVRAVGAAVKRLEVGSSLSIPELLGISGLLDAAARAKAYDRNADREAPDALTGYFSVIEPLSPLNAEIKRCILSEEEVSDDASPGLRSVRRAIRSANDRIHSQLNALLISSRTYLQDGVITMRDGRYCLPVKAEHKASVPGLIHDQSGSGSTYFIEPMAVVRLNNELKELSIAEQKEIEKVLAALSNEAAGHTEALLNNYKMLTELDFRFAKARFSRTYNGTEPLFNDELRLRIKQGRHPLLTAKKVVPIDVTLGDTFRMLVITGPNTGGKTVSLKTIGLLSLMGQAGLAIPAADGSELTVFSDVFADIGDEQSIEQNLSTFSAHMTNIVRILKEADERALILFDELGAGTDPTEGAALALAILLRLHRAQIRTVATTHYSELKLFALGTEGVENACCEFDVETLRPTYRLLIGVPGKSNAFAISGKLGLPADIIDEARLQISESDESLEDVISDLEAKRTALEREEQEAARLRTEIEALKAELSGKQDRLNEQRERILREAREESRQILKEAKELVDKTISNLNKSGVRVTRETELARTQLREKMNELAGTTQAAPKAARQLKASDLRLGDGVHVVSLNLNGTVSSLPNSKGELTVQMGILHSTVRLDDLELLPDEASEEGRISSGASIKMSKSLTVPTELNLIGLRVDEAMPILDKYLDDAYLAHLPKVRIIHGRGTGTLRAAVLSMLRKNKNVASYGQAEYNEGGYGATVAVFK